ncbi:hypothetical protein M0R88_11480 [Halorussus gelatinilyticus]|uniref:Uncharacterized protein n=1 Tax=Halorussus gelatinilyticus TaxID=2937524 RepID=A0A8U0IE04_9EURY|nr:hypothetical protein [Halorussus gelatinilyticus]UPV99147.1 hypothetical protein M0R88_11480 [Halorussus gelatinilyticus]
MHGPLPDSRFRFAHRHLTWLDVLVSYAMMLAIPVAMWAASNLVTGGIAVAATAGLLVVGRRAYELARCFSECGGFALDVGGKARITVAWTHTDDSC